MKRQIVRSVLAILAGLVFIAVTHTATDKVCEGLGILPQGHLNVGAGLIWFVLGYRAILSAIGCGITAWLAPSRAMTHAIVLGSVGLVLSSAAAFMTADLNLAPQWYGWTLAASSLPAAWLGGRLYHLIFASRAV